MGLLDNAINSILFPKPCPTYTINLAGLCRMGSTPVLHIKRTRHKRRGVIIFLHGNGCDLGSICRFVYRLSVVTQCDVVAPEYPGYGLMTSQSATIFSCVKICTAVLRQTANMYIDEDLFIVAQSIGTGLAAQVLGQFRPANLRRVFFISPFASIQRLAQETIPWLGKLLVPDILNTQDSLCQDLYLTIMHGVDDQLIPIQHAQTLERGRAHCELVAMEGGHNNLNTERLLSIIGERIHNG